MHNRMTDFGPKTAAGRSILYMATIARSGVNSDHALSGQVLTLT